MIIINNNNDRYPFLILFLELLFWTKIQKTKNIEEMINEIPPNPKTKLELTLSNAKENKIVIEV